MLNLIGNLQALNLIYETRDNYDLECYQQELYLAGFSNQSPNSQLQVFKYDQAEGIWLELYQQEITVNKESFDCQVKFYKLNNSDGKDNFLIIVKNGGNYHYLKLKEKDIFVEIKANSLLGNLLNSLYINQSKGFYLLENHNSEKLDQKKLKYYSDWQQEPEKIIDLPKKITEPKSKISHISYYQNNLYLGYNDLPLGINFYKLSLDELDENQINFVPIILKGAYRYTLNQTIFATVVFQDCLYLACGLDVNKKKTSQFEYNKNAFELIRIYHNDDWDIIAGSPVFSPQGLKVPLSALDYGFDDNNNMMVEDLIIHENQLCLSTKNIENLQIWLSDNGEDWQQKIIDLPLNNYAEVNMIKTFSFSSDLVFLIEFNNLDKTKDIKIFAYR